MRNPAALVPEQTPSSTVYLVINDYRSTGKAYVETDVAAADRETIIQNMLSGEYSSPVQVVAFDVEAGWARDVSEDIAREVAERSAGRRLDRRAKEFVERYSGRTVT
jgi:hypothetical protein